MRHPPTQATSPNGGGEYPPAPSNASTAGDSRHKVKDDSNPDVNTHAPIASISAATNAKIECTSRRPVPQCYPLVSLLRCAM